MATQRVLVHELVTPDDLAGRGEVLEAALASQAGPADSPWFESLPAGCFRWERGSQRDLPGPRSVRSAETAHASAAEFMKRVNAAAADRAAGTAAAGRALAPFAVDALRPATARPVFQGTGGSRRGRGVEEATEWLSTWMAWLPSDPDAREQRTPVVGATVELRIAPDGTVTTVSSRVRQVRASVAVPAYEWRPEDSDAHGSGGGGHHEHAGEQRERDEGPPLIYLSDPPTEELAFWSPYWFVEVEEGEEESHHARRLWPACEHSVMPEIVIEDQRGEAILRAQLLRPGQTTELARHGEEWTVRWAVASMAEVLLGERSVSEGSFVSLGTGLYQVGLEVVHNATGARRSTTTQLVVPGEDAYEIPLEDDPLVS